MSVKVKFYNDSNEDLTIGVFGESSTMSYRLQIQAGGRYTQTFQSGGDRVFVAWDDFSDKFYPSFDRATLALSVFDGDRIKARIDQNGWALAYPAPGATDFGQNF